jgi:hypothetical protein
MSLKAAVWLVVLIPVVLATQAFPGPPALLAPQPTTDCDAGARATLDAAAREVERGAYEVAVDRLRAGYDASKDCRALTIAAWSARGWLAAREAENLGGTPEALADVRTVVETVEPLGGPSSAAAYAVAVLRAAAAAAQDEREEMSLWLEHARAIAEPLGTAGAAPRWPLPIDTADGELWLAVNDDELAEAAFTRALATRENPAAWRGLARARAGRNRLLPACEAYRRMLASGPDGVARPLAAEAERFLQGCPL